MSYFEWSESLSVNIPSVDRQHKVLIDHINRVAKVIESKRMHELGIAIDKLVSYTKLHFSYEEQIFKIYSYEDTDNHLALHDNLFKQIGTFEQIVLENQLNLDELLIFLKKWVETHILKEDKQYAAFLGGRVS